jgi:hypothetical protein
MVTFSPAPLLQYFTGQAAIQAWQFTHFSLSILMTGDNSFFIEHAPFIFDSIKFPVFSDKIAANRGLKQPRRSIDLFKNPVGS